MAEPRRSSHLAATGTITVTNTSGHAELHGVVVGTGAASAVLTIKDITNATTAAVIDASAKGFYEFFGTRLQGGFTAVLSGGNADVTVIYS